MDRLKDSLMGLKHADKDLEVNMPSTMEATAEFEGKQHPMPIITYIGKTATVSIDTAGSVLESLNRIASIFSIRLP